jgi:threonine/homoserine/homoserine lactone efflux protein
MPLEQLLALAVLAFVGSFTPGPNNMIATVTGANHGFRAALPHVFGVPFGFASMLIAGALGVAALLLNYPFIAALLKWAGIAYLLFISWQLARPQVTGEESNRPAMKPLSFWQSAAFQYANPKAWMLVAATRRIVHDEQCDACQHCNYRDRLFDRGHGKSYYLGLGRRRPAKLARRGLAIASL